MISAGKAGAAGVKRARPRTRYPPKQGERDADNDLDAAAGADEHRQRWQENGQDDQENVAQQPHSEGLPSVRAGLRFAPRLTTPRRVYAVR